jgi:hypothetical protein
MPFAGSEEQRDVHEAVQHPKGRAEEAPMATDAQILAAWKCDPWGEGLFLVAGGKAYQSASACA